MMEYITGLTFGFLGSAHCIGMCGPIVLALPVGGRSRTRLLTGRLIYSVGRVITYTALGAAVGLLGGKLLLPLFQQNLSIVVGGTILAVALAPRIVHRLAAVSPLQPLYLRVSNGIGTLIRNESMAAMLGLGVLNGLLPCGFVYLAIAGAAVSANMTGGMMFMAGFGFGTVPAMLAISLFPGMFSVRIRSQLAKLLPAVTIVVGILLIVRGLNLGIPYLSPRFNAPTVEHAEPECCHED